MTASEIRQTFLEFFKSKGHEIVPSAPMVIKNDPTLMFTNAGMNQFKDLFLGNSPIKYPRIADTQKCLRVSGKHNDLEEVGVDTYHHTMFEMLGNWSFGDYFKAEAIAWSWELLTEVYRLNKERLYVTVFEGSAEDKLEFDQEAYDHWKKVIPENRILKGNKKDNFWEMGDTGPCGPCSEIHYDCRSEDERKKVDGATLVNNDHPQVIEIWNNVFMEFNRKADGSLEKLPAQHVDTGMGFERLVRVMQNKHSNYDTDVFMPLIQKIEHFSGKNYTGDSDRQQEETINIAMRVIADHIRAIAFAIADGQLPSNTGAGYVIRRILRRAVRYGYQSLELKDPFIHRLVEPLAAQMGHAFPELNQQKQLIENVIREEETSFYRTLEIGLKKLDTVCEQLTKEKKNTISGDIAFELYDTFGFPLDLTSLIAKSYGIAIDEKGFEKELQKQKERSRAATNLETDDWVILLAGQQQEFIGYDSLEGKVKLIQYRKINAKGKVAYQLVFDKTPFYPEGGGQVGDSGFIQSANEKITIYDTKKENNLIISFSEKLPLHSEEEFLAKVNLEKRQTTQCNHSATHLLHEALREVLGTHVEQKGSLVNSDYLRFDFSHFSKMSDEEIKKVEELVNAKIKAAIPLEEFRSLPIEQAKEMGAMALFGEKYGDQVRVIRFANSIELCGGTHVPNTSRIALFKINSESAVAAGVRRIEAITGSQVQNYYQHLEETVKTISALLKQPKQIEKAVENLIQQNNDLQKKLEAVEKEKIKTIKSHLISEIHSVNGVNYLAKEVDLDANGVKDLAYQIKGQVENLFLVLANKNGDKANISVMISDNLVDERKLHAGTIVKDLAKEIKGGGGGQAFFASAGGTDASGIARALEKAEQFISKS